MNLEQKPEQKPQASEKVYEDLKTLKALQIRIAILVDNVFRGGKKGKDALAQTVQDTIRKGDSLDNLEEYCFHHIINNQAAIEAGGQNSEKYKQVLPRFQHARDLIALYTGKKLVQKTES